MEGPRSANLLSLSGLLLGSFRRSDYFFIVIVNKIEFALLGRDPYSSQRRLLRQMDFLDPCKQLILDLIEWGHLCISADCLDIVGLGLGLDGL
jgi:hypothetical protein